MALSWFRNCETVEEEAHASGICSEEDMLRMNSLATARCKETLDVLVHDTEMLGEEDDELLELFEDHLEQLSGLLPSIHLIDAYQDEREALPEVTTELVRALGIRRYLSFMILYAENVKSRWWRTPGFQDTVERIARASPPESDTFTSKLADAPWELSDEQADFFIKQERGF